MAQKNLLDNQALIYVGGGVLAYYAIVRPILSKLGVVKSADEIANDNAGIAEDAWNPTFWSKQSGSLILTTAAATNYAAIVWNAFGVLADDFSAIYGVIKSLKTKSQVSYLCDFFFKKYGKNMYSFMRDGGGILPWDGLSESHMKQINDYVKSLPAFKV